MKIAILGAGLLGTTSAWYLQRDGHEVTVIDRQPGAALETSFANGAQISVSYAEPWANPAAPRKILKWLGQEDAPLLFRLRADVRQWAWGLAFLRECSAARAHHNTTQLTRMGLYSRARLIELRHALRLEYDQLQKGILHLYQSEAEYRDASAALKLMRELGCTIDMKTPDEMIAIEPALAHYKSHLIGGAYAPDDESGDAYRFTVELAARAAAIGVKFRYDTQIERLIKQGDALEGIVLQRANEADTETLQADAYVMCLGSWSGPMLRTVGVTTSIYPVKGYSATLPIKPGAKANVVSLTDHERLIVITRLGNHVRIAGTAEMNGYNTQLNATRCAALSQRAEEILPGVLDHSQVRYWTGLRPATPSNLPYIGRSRLSNLWLNTGHGTLGWTHAAGSGRALADLMGQRRPELDFAFCGMN